MKFIRHSWVDASLRDDVATSNVPSFDPPQNLSSGRLSSSFSIRPRQLPYNSRRQKKKKRKKQTRRQKEKKERELYSLSTPRLVTRAYRFNWPLNYMQYRAEHVIRKWSVVLLTENISGFAYVLPYFEWNEYTKCALTRFYASWIILAYQFLYRIFFCNFPFFL